MGRRAARHRDRNRRGRVAPFNSAGMRAYEKAGFVEEGRHRQSVLYDGAGTTTC
jgi:RimJ/RimL family protein N-acetyltransferase